MRLLRRRFLELIAGAAVLPTTICLTWAETYPSRPITMMAGFPPGGPTDTLARILGDAMGRSLGQTVVIETVSGASGTIATGRVVHANPDGYTIGIGNCRAQQGRRRRSSIA
jgi:tripartite-type tricarboxylate transporter receptor subunit TctC